MTPRREPHLDNEGEESNDDFRAYEVDGWRVGYEIEMNGVGIVNDRDSEDGSSFPDTDPDTDDDLNSDDEIPRHAGYRSLRFEMEERSPENLTAYEEMDQSQSTNCDDGSKLDDGSTSSTTTGIIFPIRKEFVKLLEERSKTSKTAYDEPIPHQPNDIILDADKVEAIREAMSGFTLPPPPQWAGLHGNQLNEIIKEKIISTSLSRS